MKIGPATDTFSPDLEWWFNCADAATGNSSTTAQMLDRIELFGRRKMPHDASMARRPTMRPAAKRVGRKTIRYEVQDQRAGRKLYPAYRDSMTDARLGAVDRARLIHDAWHRTPQWAQEVLTLVYAHDVNVEAGLSRRAHYAFRLESRGDAIERLHDLADLTWAVKWAPLLRQIHKERMAERDR